MKRLSLQHFLVFALVSAQAAFASGGPVTNNRYSDSLSAAQGTDGATGPTGPTGPAGAKGTFSAAYGQLYSSSSQTINFPMNNEMVVIPFSAFGPFSNMDGTTSSPATITILDPGTYQMSVTLYLLTNDSMEGSYTATNLTLGISVNGGSIVPYSAVHAADSGYYSINYSTIEQFSANDYIQFYIQTSAAAGGGPFSNVISLVSSNAYLMQIAD